jgi:hypothetical protein
VRLPSFKGEIAPLPYAAAALALLLSQHLAVALAFGASGSPLVYDAEFWLLPLRRLASLPGLAPSAAAIAFAFSLAIAWGLALLSYRRASRSGVGYVLAALSIVPAIQIAAVTWLAVMPVRPPDMEPEQEAGVEISHVMQGVVAGIAIIVFAVLVSALMFGAYGWGLFVMTPFLVGVTTGYLSNRRAALEPGRTLALVMAAAGLGTLALIMVALEGFVCILLASPLGAAAAAAGGALGRAAALTGQRGGKPLMSLALLPAIFALEAAVPPAIPIKMHEAILISAPPYRVWQALTSNEPIGAPPGLIGRAGLSYPIRGRLVGRGVGAERLGEFSTGTARERITDWAPGRRLAFAILSQPPVMEEMSPYRRVHAPHVSGYFETIRTSFDLEALPGGGTRLTARADHILRMDPVLYWEPMARWAIHVNVLRVLEDIKTKAETRSSGHKKGGGESA